MGNILSLWVRWRISLFKCWWLERRIAAMRRREA